MNHDGCASLSNVVGHVVSNHAPVQAPYDMCIEGDADWHIERRSVDEDFSDRLCTARAVPFCRCQIGPETIMKKGMKGSGVESFRIEQSPLPGAPDGTGEAKGRIDAFPKRTTTSGSCNVPSSNGDLLRASADGTAGVAALIELGSPQTMRGPFRMQSKTSTASQNLTLKAGWFFMSLLRRLR